LRLKPDWPEAHNNLAWILATHPDEKLRNGAEAVAHAQRACELTRYRVPIMVGTLAAAYAEAGSFDDAIATAQKAHEMALTKCQTELAKKNLELLNLYRSGKPYRELLPSTGAGKP
jgi:tetratricopeptide (TPR) repeat protein